MSITGNFARGTRCCGVTSVDFGLYSRMVGGGNSGSRPSAGRGRICPGAWVCCASGADSESATHAAASTNRDLHMSVNRFYAEENFAASRKPNSVSPRALSGDRQMTIIPLAPSSLADSSDRPGDFGRAVLTASPYLVLLRAGFCLPPMLPPARCALTAPFHPYPSARAANSRPSSLHGRYIFCATFLRVALTGRYPAHCPAEFGLSSHAPLRARGRSSGSLRSVDCTARLKPALHRVRHRGATSAHSSATPERLIRRFPARSDTARVSCTDCCAACR